MQLRIGLMLAKRFKLMHSWWLACELVRRHPELSVAEMHPAGGMYDSLSLFHNGQELININREGRIHVPDSPGFEPVTFDDLVAAEEPGDVLAIVERAARLNSLHVTPSSTPAVLTYRVIAQLMAITVNDKRHWDVRNERFDSSDPGGGGDRGYLAEYPVAAARARETRSDDLLGSPLYRYWGALRDGKLVAVLDTDGFAYVSQQVWYLPELYAASSRRLTPLVASTLGPLLP